MELQRAVKRACARCLKRTDDRADRQLWLAYSDYKFYRELPAGASGEPWVFGADCIKAILANGGNRDW
jgi:hypothetical protein